MKRQPRYAVFWLVLSFALGGCGSTEDETLQAWMAKVRSEAVPGPVREPGPLVVHPVAYDPENHPDPFDAGKITSLSAASSATGLQPDLQRPPEPLESFPLDSLRMVGSLLRKGQAVALVQADKMIYQVRNGHHLGQDQGKVISISETAIDIEEIVQESAGTWTTRKVQLTMQGGK